jgi:hypothetical protein
MKQHLATAVQKILMFWFLWGKEVWWKGGLIVEGGDDSVSGDVPQPAASPRRGGVRGGGAPRGGRGEGGNWGECCSPVASTPPTQRVRLDRWFYFFTDKMSTRSFCARV